MTSTTPRTLRSVLRSLRVRLNGPARRRRPPDRRDELAQLARAGWMIRGFYLITLYFAFDSQRQLFSLVASNRQVDPLWPVAWIDQSYLAAAANGVGLAFVASAVAAVILPERRVVRGLVALFFLQALALENSFGSINHYGHLGLWLALAFVVLPNFAEDRLRRSRVGRRACLTLTFLAQALVALFYTSSGARKTWYGFVVAEGSVSSFAPDALPLLVVQKWLERGDAPLFAQVFMDHVWLAWPAHLLVIYVELFALVAIFRPELHVLWGALLMVFHLMVWLLLGIPFPYQPVLIALVFVWSPFAPRPHPGIRQVLRQLPLFGDLAAALGLTREARRKPGEDLVRIDGGEPAGPSSAVHKKG